MPQSVEMKLPCNLVTWKQVGHGDFVRIAQTVPAGKRTLYFWLDNCLEKYNLYLPKISFFDSKLIGAHLRCSIPNQTDPHLVPPFLNVTTAGVICQPQYGGIFYNPKKVADAFFNSIFNNTMPLSGLGYYIDYDVVTPSSKSIRKFLKEWQETDIWKK